jgi:hypothetical protein
VRAADEIVFAGVLVGVVSPMRRSVTAVSMRDGMRSR